MTAHHRILEGMSSALRELCARLPREVSRSLLSSNAASLRSALCSLTLAGAISGAPSFSASGGTATALFRIATATFSPTFSPSLARTVAADGFDASLGAAEERHRMLILPSMRAAAAITLAAHSAFDRTDAPPSASRLRMRLSKPTVAHLNAAAAALSQSIK